MTTASIKQCIGLKNQCCADPVTSPGANWIYDILMGEISPLYRTISTNCNTLPCTEASHKVSPWHTEICKRSFYESVIGDVPWTRMGNELWVPRGGGGGGGDYLTAHRCKVFVHSNQRVQVIEIWQKAWVSQSNDAIRGRPKKEVHVEVTHHV